MGSSWGSSAAPLGSNGIVVGPNGMGPQVPHGPSVGVPGRCPWALGPWVGGPGPPPRRRSNFNKTEILFTKKVTLFNFVTFCDQRGF